MWHRRNASLLVTALSVLVSCLEPDSSPETAGGGRGPESAPVDNAPQNRAPSARTVEIELGEMMALGRLAFLPTTRGTFESGSTTWYGETREQAFYVVPAASMGEPVEGGMTFKTTEIKRENWSWPTNRSFASDPKGGLVRTGDGASEWLRGRDEGVEQGWTFESEPAGQGDLVVRVAIDNGEFSREDRTGLHFTTDGGGVVYGHGTWIDSTGAETPVPATWTRDAIELAVPADLLAESAYPATLDPVVGPESATDAPVLGPDDSGASPPLVACTATMCMAAWNDSGGISRIRLTPDGTMVDPTPTRHALNPQFSSLGVLGVGAMSNGFLIVTSTATGLLARLINEDGSEVASHAWDVPSSGSTACSAERCVVTYRLGGDVLSRRIDAAGTLLDPFGTLVGTASGFGSSHVVAFDGTNFIIHLGEGRVRRMTPSGITLDANPIDVLFSSRPISILASDGSSTVAAGSDGFGGSFRRINSDGSLGPIVNTARVHGLGWIGGSYLASLDPLGTLQRIDANGNGIGAPFVPFGAQALLAVYPRPGGGFVVSQGVLGGPLSSNVSDANLRVVDSSGVQVSAVTLNLGTNPQFSPAVIAGQSQYLVAWGDRRLGTTAVYGQRFSAAATPIDPAPFMIFSTPAPDIVRLVSGAFDGTNYLVAGGGVSVQAGRVPMVGPPLDLGSIALSGFDPNLPQRRLAVTWDGATFAVFQRQSQAFLSIQDSVRVQRLLPSGQVLDGTPIVVVNDGLGLRPGLAASADGVGHVVLWRDGSDTPRFRRLTSGGTFTGPSATFGAPSSSTTNPLAMRCTSTDCLVYGVDFLRTLSGVNVPLPPGSPTASYAAMALGGSEFLVLGGAADVSGLRVSNAATPAPIGGWFNISQSPADSEVSASAAALGDGSALAAYERFVPGEDANRVFLRGIVLASPNGADCASNEDCQSGQCVDGVCCNVACGGGTTDCQACSTAAGAAVNGTCGPISAGTQCRASGGACDVAEACDGTSLTCPANAFAASSVECRASAGACDVAETCTGANANCPADQFLPAATTCRPSAGVCDVVESCTGSSATCPVNAVAPSSTVCRPSTGDCDLADQCDGAGVACPTDALEPAGVVCRVAAGLCDAEETCTGSAGECPQDELLASGTSCRDSIGDCDLEDFCDGASTDCEDEGEPADTPCGSAPSGVCDAQDTCEGGPGSTNSCVDRILGSSVSCRESAGPCDVAESCGSAGPNCPEDSFVDQGLICRNPASDCDEAEVCDGVGAACPDDELLPDGAPCDDGVCDAGECVPQGGAGAGGGGAGGSGNGGEGAASSGGGPAGNGGSSSNGGSAGGADPSEDGGCNCTTAAASDPTRAAWAVLAALGVALRRRRRAALQAARNSANANIADL
jgi:MYXO-CTERM domain-containing protein